MKRRERCNMHLGTLHNPPDRAHQCIKRKGHRGDHIIEIKFGGGWRWRSR